MAHNGSNGRSGGPTPAEDGEDLARGAAEVLTGAGAVVSVLADLARGEREDWTRDDTVAALRTLVLVSSDVLGLAAQLVAGGRDAFARAIVAVDSCPGGARDCAVSPEDLAGDVPETVEGSRRAAAWRCV